MFGHWAVTYSEWRSREYPDSYYRVEQILRCHLIPAFGHLPIGAITAQHGEQYKHARLELAAPNTVRQELQVLKATLNLAVKWEIIERSRLAHVSAPRDINSRPPRYFTADELAQIYAAETKAINFQTADDHELHRRYRWSWQLLANTGLRRGEAQSLLWRDVGQDEIRVLSEEGARTKSGKWRIIPVTMGAETALRELKGERTVLPLVAPTSLSRAFDRTLKKVDIPGSLHCLRHTYCSHLVMTGVPLRTVQVLAGHASYTTTERYAHLAPGHLQEMTRNLNL